MGKIDLSCKLNEAAAIGTRISEETQRGPMSASKANFNGYAPLELTGTINPLMEDLFVDLKVRFKDMDLSFK